MSKNQQELPKPDLNASNEAATNFGEAAKKFGEEASKLPLGTVPGVTSYSSVTGGQSSTTTHDSVRTHNGEVVSEEHWTKTTGETQPETHP